MPASSRQDPLLARADPIRDGEGASGVTHVRSGGNTAAQQQLQPDERGVKIREKKPTLQTHMSVQKEGQDILQAPEQGFSCSLWCRPWGAKLCPTAHEGPWWSRDPRAAHGGLHARAGGSPK